MSSRRERDAGTRAEKPERTRKVGDGIAEGTGGERQSRPAQIETTGDETPMLMEEVLHRENLVKAYKRVRRNAGAPGVDGMTVDELMPYCRANWARTREELLNRRYRPQPVLKVAPSSVKRLKAKIRPLFRTGRGCSLRRTTETLAPLLRGWVAYFRLSDVKASFESLDAWLRRKLRFSSGGSGNARRRVAANWLVEAWIGSALTPPPTTAMARGGMQARAT